MCGFVAIISEKENATIGEGLIQSMNDRIAHRGPDDWGTMVFDKTETSYSLNQPVAFNSGLPFHIKSEHQILGHLAFGHRRLAIQDLSEMGHQPISDQTGRYWLVFNGEIFNFLELRKELEKAGVSFFSDTDTEILLQAYVHYGKAMLNKLDGFYAFLILDTKENTIFGARDCTGVKPMYYTKCKSEWYFASEIKCFYEIPDFEWYWNSSTIQDYLLHGKVEVNNETFYQGVFQIMPGEIVEIDLGKLDFKISKFQYEAIPSKVSLKEQIIEGIRKRLISDVPIGFASSGGLDSTLLASVSSTLMDKEINLFSSNSAHPELDESHWQKLAHEKIGGKWHKTVVDTTDLNLEFLNYIQDCPILGANTLAHFQMCSTVRKLGVKVFLNGQGADELFAGYPYYYAHYYLELNSKDRRNFLQCLDNAPLSIKELKQYVWKIRLRQFLPRNWIESFVNRKKSYSKYMNQDYLKNSSFSKLIPKGTLKEVLTGDYYGQRLREMLHWEDRNTMAFGIESRNPFADDRGLAEMALALPNNKKIHLGWSKYFLRDEFKEYLPDAIAKRVDKKGFVMPDMEWNRQWVERIRTSLFNEQLDAHVDRKSILAELDKLMATNDIQMHQFLFRVMSLSVFMQLDKKRNYEMA